VTVGRRWFWGGQTLAKLRRAAPAKLPDTQADDAAAIIFTSGSTGPPKGVLYTHRMFDTQAAEIQQAYNIQPGAVDLACFPLFGLFNSAMGVTTVFPDMNFSRPASADPKRLLTAAHDWQVTQSFASPAVWDKLSRYCAEHNESIDSLRQVFSCGAPVPAKLLGRTLFAVHPQAKMHTPYGATECLPVSTIEAQEVLHETAEMTNQGAGICVGRRFPTIEWKVIRITDEPIATMDQAEELPRGQIGELVVRGPQASPAYVTRAESNAFAKIRDAPSPSEIRNQKSEIRPWHRMGDVGYLDDQDRFWYCGRKAHRVETTAGALYSIPIEEVFNTHPSVRRSALVNAKTATGVAPVMVLDLADGCNEQDVLRELAQMAQDSQVAQHVRHMLLRHDLPVDVRHNSKIRREDLSDWASSSLSDASS
jgi:acyl-CoA synthetase (AMP-forming)/AMP-acid ligase II